MSATGEVVILFDPQSIHDDPLGDDELVGIDWGTDEKRDPGREPREGRRDLRALLMEEDGLVLFTWIGGLDREARTAVVREVGWRIEVDGDDPFKLPRWYQRVDLVELRAVIDRMLDEAELDPGSWDLRDWYPAPMMEAE